MRTHLIDFSLLAICLAVLAPGGVAEPRPIVPVIEGEWWIIAENPTLPDGIHSERQQPVDFGVWQAADGTWQLWSCIRHTNIGGHTRLFFGWEGESLDKGPWRPAGIKMTSKPELGEAPGGLQAPHVVRLSDRYLMAYGDWDEIAFAESRDGKTFERIVQANGRTGVFGEGPGANSRDAMLLNADGLWYCYYTGIENGKGYGYARTSRDLKSWSDSFVISYGGHVGPSPWRNECPHVVEPRTPPRTPQHREQRDRGIAGRGTRSRKSQRDRGAGRARWWRCRDCGTRQRSRNPSRRPRTIVRTLFHDAVERDGTRTRHRQAHRRGSGRKRHARESRGCRWAGC